MKEVTPSLPVASWGGIDTVSGEITATRNPFCCCGFTAFLPQCFSPGTDEFWCNWIHLWPNKDTVLSLDAVEWSQDFYSTAGLLISGHSLFMEQAFLLALNMALHHPQSQWLWKKPCPTEDGISSNILVPKRLDPPPLCSGWSEEILYCGRPGSFLLTWTAGLILLAYMLQWSRSGTAPLAMIRREGSQD